MGARRAILAWALVSAAAVAHAQQVTVGEILEKGARRLDGSAFREAFVGKYTVGYNAAGAEWKGTFAADGRYTGTSHNLIGGSLWARGKVLAFYGPWTVDQEGTVCFQLRFSPGTGQRDGCIVTFSWNDELYAAEDAHPATAVFLRKPEKPFWWQ